MGILRDVPAYKSQGLLSLYFNQHALLVKIIGQIFNRKEN
jgi:hypothetical protein